MSTSLPRARKRAPRSAAIYMRDSSAKTSDAVIAVLNLRLRLVRIATLVLGFGGIATAVVAAEDVYSNRMVGMPLVPSTNPTGRSPTSDATKSVSTVLTAFLLMCVAIKYVFVFRLYAAQRRLIPQQRFMDTDLPRNLALELLVCAVHCPAGCYGLVTITNAVAVPITYDYDSLLSALMFVRLGMLVAMLIKEASGFHTPASAYVQRALNISFDSSFATRHLLDASPVISSLVIYVFTVGVLTYAMRVAERPVCRTPASITAAWCTPFKDVDSPYNAAWLIVITTLTVGYGDMFPYTQLGRLVSVIAAVVGIVIIALLVNAVSASTRFNPDENRALALLSKRQIILHRKECASRVIGASFLYMRDRVRQGRGRLSPLHGHGNTANDVARGLHRRPLGLASTKHVSQLARALGSWASHHELYVDNARCKDSGEEVKRDVDRLGVSLVELHQKLDMLLVGVGAPAARKKQPPPPQGQEPQLPQHTSYNNWERLHNENGDVWYENAATMETSWDLPPGGRVVRDTSV